MVLHLDQRKLDHRHGLLRELRVLLCELSVLLGELSMTLVASVEFVLLAKLGEASVGTSTAGMVSGLGSVHAVVLHELHVLLCGLSVLLSKSSMTLVASVEFVFLAEVSEASVSTSTAGMVSTLAAAGGIALSLLLGLLGSLLCVLLG